LDVPLEPEIDYVPFPNWTRIADAEALMRALTELPILVAGIG